MRWQVDRLKAERQQQQRQQPTQSGLPTTEGVKAMTAQQLEPFIQNLEELLLVAMSQRQEKAQCVVCMSKPKSIVFYPCKHKCVCETCSQRMSQCPICRAKIVDALLPYD